MKLQITKKIFTFIITIMMLCGVTKSANAQKCSPIHPCPAGYTCVGFHCKKTVSPLPFPGCNCSSDSVPQPITINFQLKDAASVSLKIYEASGRLIRTLAAEYMEKGSHLVEWNEKDEDGNTVSAGIYILQFDSPDKSEAKKLAVIN
jgi:hypothetical protein